MVYRPDQASLTHCQVFGMHGLAYSGSADGYELLVSEKLKVDALYPIDPVLSESGSGSVFSDFSIT